MVGETNEAPDWVWTPVDAEPEEEDPRDRGSAREMGTGAGDWPLQGQTESRWAMRWGPAAVAAAAAAAAGVDEEDVG